MNIIPSIPLYIKTYRTKYRKRSWGWIVLSINSYCERKPKTLHTWLSICAELLNFPVTFKAAIPFTFYYDMQNMRQPQYCHKNRDDEPESWELGGWPMVLQHGKGLLWDQTRVFWLMDHALTRNESLDMKSSRVCHPTIF